MSALATESGVAFVIPYAGDCRFRGEALLRVTAGLSQFFPAAQVVIGESDPLQPWVKADAVSDGLARVKGDPIIVVHDADSWSSTTYRAISAVQRGRADWAMPHTYVHRLTREATRLHLDGDSLSPGALALERDVYEGIIGGGIVVLRPGLYREVPLDPRFEGWGREDRAWGFALRELGGRFARVADGKLYHFWHPRAHREEGRDAGGSAQNDALYERYVAARSAGGLGAIVAEYASQEGPDGAAGTLPVHVPPPHR